ncbi:universal stress protein [Sinomonas sp. P47F7]|uniref:universal stress protein n=1 Tax=Sinomonas sp. P47F7 TaxID=3410987 RepID=UPI003BF4CDD8
MPDIEGQTDPQPETGYRPRRLEGPVLAGVVPGQGLAVLHRAVDLAHGLGVGLVCAYADPTVISEDEPGGRVELLSIDPDAVDDDAAQIRADLLDGLRGELSDAGITWSFAALSGEPAHALASCAREVGASLIVVGTHEDSLAHRFEERIAGSVAARLGHSQDLPLVVVPLAHRRRRLRGDS